MQVSVGQKFTAGRTAAICLPDDHSYLHGLTATILHLHLMTNNYRTSITCIKERDLCAQIRCGILPQHIETGRYGGAVEDERICEYFEVNEAENYIYFILYCSLYELQTIYS